MIYQLVLSGTVFSLADAHDDDVLSSPKHPSLLSFFSPFFFSLMDTPGRETTPKVHADDDFCLALRDLLFMLFL